MESSSVAVLCLCGAVWVMVCRFCSTTRFVLLQLWAAATVHSAYSRYKPGAASLAEIVYERPKKIPNVCISFPPPYVCAQPV